MKSLSLYRIVEIHIGKLEPEQGYPVRLTIDQHQYFSSGYLSPNITDWNPTAEPLKDGQWLFEQLFTAEQQTKWAAIRGQAPHRQIRLRIDTEAAELHTLPWELLHDVTPGLPTQLLTQQATTPFSRYWESDQPRVQPLFASPEPIRMLAVLANPDGLDHYNLPPLDIPKEKVLLETAVAGLTKQNLLSLTFLDETVQHVTLEAIEAALRTDPPYHLLHIVAHGIYNKKRKQSALLLTDPFEEKARFVTDKQICGMLKNQASLPHLIVLTSCHSATRDPNSAHYGLAPRLMTVGVPAVLAMQDAVSIRNARIISQVFYPHLFQHGLVDLATNQARATLATKQQPGIHVPVLFSRLPDNRLLLTGRDPLGNQAMTPTEYRNQFFAEKYRLTVADHLDRVQLFGLDDQHLGRHAPQRKYPLSVAYIPLRLEQETPAGMRLDEVDDPQPIPALKHDLAEASSVEQVLYHTQNNRLFIQGEAGSGKTTLLSWIAVQAAQRNLPDFLSPWNQAVPFFLRLRRCSEQLPLPPKDFLTLESKFMTLMNDMPSPTWVEQRLQAGQGIVLIDGFDEVPTAKHQAVIDWLADLVEEFPNNRYLVTSRPLRQVGTAHKTVDNPLQDLGFAFAWLPPMDDEEITALIEHWHQAVAARLQSRTDEPAQQLLARLPNLAKTLPAKILNEPRLKELAEIPLLCAMLCARHRDREGRLPTSRIQLYQESIRMLLGNRDKERDIPRPDLDNPDYPDLQWAEKIGCLQEVAYWMMDEGQSEISQTIILEKIEHRLRQYHTIPNSVTARQLLDFYLNRSSLLRPAGANYYIFAHRTFQEYLAALEIKGLRKMHSLLRQSGDSEWHETISLFINLVDAHDANEALCQLITMVADEPPERQRQQYLLVMFCLREHDQNIDTPAQQAIATAIQRLLPPQSNTEATMLAYAKQWALPHLIYQANHHETEVVYCIQVLAEIGGPDALTLLKNYASDQRENVQRALLSIWDRFDHTRFAQEILTINFAGQTELNYHGRLTSLEGIQYLPHLQRLYLRHTQVSDLTPLQPLTNMQQLSLRHTQVSDLTPLQYLTNLQSLSLINMRVNDLIPLQHLTNLQSLYLMNTRVSDLTPLQHLTNLQSLSLSDVQVSDLTPLQYLTNLQQLDLKHTQVSDLIPLQHLTNLQQLDVRHTQVSDLTPLQYLTNLHSLYLINTQVGDLTSLQCLTNLQILSLRHTQVSDLTPLQSLTSLQTLYLSYTQVNDLSPLLELPALQQVDLSNVSNASALLADMPTYWLAQVKVIR